MIRKTDSQLVIENKYKELRKKWKLEKGVSVSVFETAVQRIILKTKPEEIAKLVQEYVGTGKM